MWNGFPVCQGTGAGRDGCRDVPAEPGLGRPHRHDTCRLSRRLCESQACAESFPRHGLDPCWFQDQVNVSEGGAGGAAKAWPPVLDLGRDSGSVGELWKAGGSLIHSLNRLLIAELSPDQAGSSLWTQTSTAVTHSAVAAGSRGTDNPWGPRATLWTVRP